MMSTVPCDNLENQHTRSPLHVTFQRILQLHHMIAVQETGTGTTHYYDTRLGWTLDDIQRSITKFDGYKIIEPCDLCEPLRSNSTLDVIINRHIRHKKTLVVRDNYENSFLYFSFEPAVGYFWSTKDIKGFIEAIGWYDLETLRFGETVSECVSRMPPRFQKNH